MSFAYIKTAVTPPITATKSRIIEIMECNDKYGTSGRDKKHKEISKTVAINA